MRDYILLYINGREHRVRGEDAFKPLTDYLRYDLGACGTKVVCAEGDCGACTIALGRPSGGNTLTYKPVNGCIQYMCQLDCSHVITVEGVKSGAELNPVQSAMVDCHGAQCGYCTPGFIVAMCSMYETCSKVDRAAVKEALSGNLCRCTGYTSIIEAALAVDPERCARFNELYPASPMIEAFKQHRNESLTIKADDGRIVHVPCKLEDAVAFRAGNPGSVIVSGGTDVCVNMNKRGFLPQSMVVLSNIDGLEKIEVADGCLVVGARATLRELEHYVKELVPELYKVLFVFGSPQIRYAGTLAGNIANASPIADSLPFLYVMDAEIEVAGTGGTRRIKIQSLYKGYKDLAMSADEVIARIFIPLPEKDEILKLYKVSKREHLDISSFTAAIRLRRKGDSISSAVIAYGGVGPVILRLPKTEEYLTGKKYELDTFREAGRVARQEITPISDVRGTCEFRYQLAENILSKFYFETAEQRETACL